jgi:hypothetical protein
MFIVSFAIYLQWKIVITSSLTVHSLRVCWNKLQITWEDGLDIHRRLLRARSATPNRLFMDIFITAAWEIWKIRNPVIFYAVAPSVISLFVWLVADGWC